MTVTKHRAVYEGTLTVKVLYSRGRDEGIEPGKHPIEFNMLRPDLNTLDVAKLLADYAGYKQVGNHVETGILVKAYTKTFEKYLGKFPGDGITKSLVKVAGSEYMSLIHAIQARPSTISLAGWTDMNFDGDRTVTWIFTLKPTSP